MLQGVLAACGCFLHLWSGGLRAFAACGACRCRRLTRATRSWVKKGQPQLLLLLHLLCSWHSEIYQAAVLLAACHGKGILLSPASEQTLAPSLCMPFAGGNGRPVRNGSSLEAALSASIEREGWRSPETVREERKPCFQFLKLLQEHSLWMLLPAHCLPQPLVSASQM